MKNLPLIFFILFAGNAMASSLPKCPSIYSILMHDCLALTLMPMETNTSVSSKITKSMDKALTLGSMEKNMSVSGKMTTIMDKALTL